MKTLSLLPIAMLITILVSLSASAEESSNQYSHSLMLEAPQTYEDPNYKTESQQHEQFCRDLEQQINKLKNQPIRRSAAKERYQKECVGN